VTAVLRYINLSPADTRYEIISDVKWGGFSENFCSNQRQEGCSMLVREWLGRCRQTLVCAVLAYGGLAGIGSGGVAHAQGAEAAPPASDMVTALLPRDLSPWGMFLSADVVVKAVLIGLAFASVLTWTIWLYKTFELWAARRHLARAQQALAAARSLAEASNAASAASSHVALLLQAVETELQKSPDRRDVDGIKERILARLERVEAAVGREMLRSTGILATIGATAPFVGLFGTVWGIMNSFIGISMLHTTNLAVVAPGIAEALLATALGLAAAIPAVMIFNLFSRSITDYRARYADARVEILTLFSRDLTQRGNGQLLASVAAE
jgi:biopolymer transport protein ExbB